MQIPILSSTWNEHSIVDSGGARKLERFGKQLLIRPEPKAWWKPAFPDAWTKADAEFLDDGRWKLRDPALPRAWNMRWGKLTLQAKLTDMSKHVGVFPEQDPHWRWMTEKLEGADKSTRVLNLFGYTGVATLAAAAAGCSVTHVDASKPSLGWARQNQELSKLTEAPIRWILEDALKYVTREIRRESRYDGILLDPPSFGRGPNGEIWKVEVQLTELLELCRQLLSDKPRFVLMTLYNLEASSLMLNNLMSDVFKRHGGTVESGELALTHEKSTRLLPLSLYGKWSV
ncbi:MAG: class I SAM-dependent methyltransferase [Verrucomicrobiota bacterium]|nr:class I SAM-dependent methyltransferase [Verrucomicrobiota bacterium]